LIALIFFNPNWGASNFSLLDFRQISLSGYVLNKFSESEKVIGTHQNTQLSIKIFLLFIVSIFFSCSKKEVSDPCLAEMEYSFFVAGHTYVRPEKEELGLYPKFVAQFDWMNEDEHLALGVLTGDMVFISSDENWEAVDRDLSLLQMPTFKTAGDHDYKTGKGAYTGIEYFAERYGKSYYHFLENQDLFIVLDPSLDAWNISGEQLEFLKETLNEKAPLVRNVFVFFHQVLWWSPDNIYRNVKINSSFGRAPKINFWTEVFPLFEALDNEVYLFAGDVGANAVGNEFFYDVNENVRLVASGMGSDYVDNFLIAEVLESGKVKLRIISLSCEEMLDCFGYLEGYKYEGG